MIATRNLPALVALSGGMTGSKLRRLKARRWKYPLSLERQYTTAIARYLDKVWREYSALAVGTMVPRSDAVDLNPDGTGPALAAIVSVAKNMADFNKKELGAFQSIAIGTAFTEDETWLPATLDRWAREQVSLITKASQDMRDAVARRVREGIKNGELGRDITRKIAMDLPRISYNRAKIIARDQTAKLNGDLTQGRMTDAGLETYIWDTAQDERVRGNPGGKYADAVPSHWVMQGLVCRWDNPAVCRNEQGEWVSRPPEAPTTHPGMAIMCRCVARPNWQELETVGPMGVPMPAPALELPESKKDPALVETKKPAREKTPLTLKNLDKRIREGLEGDDPLWDWVSLNERERFSEIMRKVLDAGDFGINVPRVGSDGNNVLDALFSSRFKSQIETGTGNGLVDLEIRKNGSRVLFGTDIEKAKPQDFEKYGFLMDRDMIRQARSGIADDYWNYGDGVQIRFKKDRVTATFTLDDSLGGEFAPSRVTAPEVTSVKPWGPDAGLDKVLRLRKFDNIVEITKSLTDRYIELQYHGTLGLDAIESIFVPPDVIPKIKPETLKKMRETGAKLFTEREGVAVEF